MFPLLYRNTETIFYFLNIDRFRLQDSVVNLDYVKTEAKRLGQTIVELEATNQVRNYATLIIICTFRNQES